MFDKKLYLILGSTHLFILFELGIIGISQFGLISFKIVFSVHTSATTYHEVLVKTFSKQLCLKKFFGRKLKDCNFLVILHVFRVNCTLYLYLHSHQNSLNIEQVSLLNIQILLYQPSFISIPTISHLSVVWLLQQNLHKRVYQQLQRDLTNRTMKVSYLQNKLWFRHTQRRIT